MTVYSYRFSIIIPLEFHRGQALRCIREWSHEQIFPRNAYQLLIAVPDHFPMQELQWIRSLLLPHDHIEQFPYHHDMALIAAVSEFANGEFLLFTESHAIPQKDTLKNLNKVITNHSEWPGFSFRSIPLTYNLLSEIEAQMYIKHIEENRLHHPWLKVLDQCFVIKNEVYWSVGGIEPKYGHFAEWVFAARLFHAGFHIQIDDSSSIHHCYIGKLQDLELFTLDFASGEMLFATEQQNDPCAKLFQDIPELLAYRHEYRNEGIRFLQLKLGFLIQAMNGNHKTSLGKVWKDCLQSIGIKLIGLPGIYFIKRCSTWLLKEQLQYHLWIRQKEQAQTLFLRWINCLITQERLHYLCNPIVQQQHVSALTSNTKGRFSWKPKCGYKLDMLGFYGPEYHADMLFQWTSYCAAIYLYLEVGSYRIEFSWLALRTLSDDDLHGMNFFLNEQKLSPSLVNLQSCKAIIQIQIETDQVYRVSWTLTPLQFPGDQRLLGLPVYSIKSEKCLAVSEPTHAQKVKDFTPVYFLHISKCGGTTLRHFFDNAFDAEEILAPYLEHYYAHELLNSPFVHQKPYSLFRGHFGWDLPESLPDQNLKIMTVLRDPLERLLSLFSYLKQYRRLDAEMTLEAWIDGQIKIPDLMVSYFVPGTRNRVESGYEITCIDANKILPKALENLENCLVVGLTEAMDDTINLFAWHSGILPCHNIPRNNPTNLKITIKELSQNLISKMKTLLESDYALYSRARELFYMRLDQLHSDVSIATGRKMDGSELQSYLISEYIERYRVLMEHQKLTKSRSWTIEDRFHGENLYGREQHLGEHLRWTGPHPATFFYYYLGKPRTWVFKLTLHRATPTQHLQSMSCQVNAKPLELEKSALADGHYLITGLIDKSVSALSMDGIATFEITTELIRGESEFRMLGIALMGFVLDPV